MMTRADAWVDRHGWQIVIGLLTIGSLWATNTAALAQKADRSAVDDLARDIKTLKYLACRDHQNDSVCRP